MSGASIVNFEHILHIIELLLLQNLNSWAWETIASDNKFVFSNCAIYSVLQGWENLLSYMFSSSCTQHKVMKE